MANVSLTTLSKEMATRLTTEFKPDFTCLHNSNVNYELKDLNQLRVDCWAQGLQRTRRNASAWDRTVTIAIAIQERAPIQEKVDLLTDMSENVLDWILQESGRWGGGKLYVSGGGFSGADLFDKLRKYDENVFQAIMLINLVQLG